MRKLILGLLLLLFFILDNTFVPFFSVYGFYPSLLFLFAVCYGVVNEKAEALWVGILSGLLQDVYFFHGFGVNAFINMIICLIAAEIGSTIFRDRSLVPIAISFLLSLFKGILVIFVLFILGQRTSINAVFFNSLYTMVASIFMYKWVYNFCQKPYMKKKWRF